MHMDHMDDSGSGLPWLDQPVWLHSSRADECELTPDQCAYRAGHWRYWYEADHVYALNTVYFLIATVGLFTILHFFSLYAPSSLKGSTPWRKVSAAGRYLSYKSFRVPVLRYWSPSLGVILLGCAGFVFFFAMTLGPKPYYWPNTRELSYGSSPPIATRTGWMALALLPFVLALSTKANLISALTGVSHERLQVFHHWTSYAMFVLALIHTFPFIIFHIWKGDMVKQYNTSIAYWTGVVALIFQTYLTLMSLPSIRNRYYEFFKATHLLAALIFILFFFLHCDFRLSSWDYFIATGAIYLFSLLAAQIRTYLIHGRHIATIDRLPCGLLRITIPTVTTTWRPAQHLFLRFLHPKLGLHTLTAHPFTVASLAHDPDALAKPSQLVFFIRPHAGVTARLDTLAQHAPGGFLRCTVTLEGPYGGVEEMQPPTVDSVVIVAGGSGGGFALGVFAEALRVLESSGMDIQVVFACRSALMARWFRDESDALMSRSGLGQGGRGRGRVRVDIHDTSSSSGYSGQQSQAQNDADGEGRSVAHDKELEPGIELLPHDSDTNTNNVEGKTQTGFYAGRPDLPSRIAEAARAAEGKKLAMYACGPASMLFDVRNAAADAQRGREGEVSLHTETFSW
ncbi:hypothetical protein P170DRAFT_354402 [Aspergillus steynii IBT 23096]|uniref:FAD-binding FR-type domain-containing protein n=1 Tax=Aspergillus steynii IBT 23096 TaxID=1392250 RepID=A0A2I2GCK1_9EURO|nr:uncharacterized protein P170DRAFT_354402 [Aspergillus steynii IBT 23096]PLB50616.1 hypothetical protein P170DRAFT_354402 [Aspergillus steynii IBT 23096]